jgi:branched-chain amino acid transport system substrate-binding protein
LHYLRSAAAAGTDDWQKVSATMRQLPIKDAVMKNPSIHPDGRVIHDMYVYEVKSPAESKYSWDYLKKVGTVPAAEAFQPLAKSTCPLVKG